MPLTSRKRRPLNYAKEPYRDARLIVIACEGQETEDQYFHDFGSSRVQVHVLPTCNGKSSPQHVLSRIRKYKREYEMHGTDQLWLMIDVDRWPKVNLARVTSEAKKLGCSLAVSNPCFETWLLLHYEDIAQSPKITCQNVKGRLRTVLSGYNSSNINMKQFSPYIKDAIGRAASVDLRPQDNWPQNYNSHVYKVVAEIKKGSSGFAVRKT